MRLIYLLPSFYKSKRKSSLGLYKDIINIEKYFLYRSIVYEKYYTSSNFFNLEDKKTIKRILKIKPKFIFLEKYLSFKFIFYLIFIKYFKLKNTQIIYRSHNAEIFHRLDFLKALFNQIKFKKSILFKFKFIFSNLKNFLLIPLKEAIILIFADVILSTNVWEKKNYWEKIYFSKAISLHPFVENNNIKSKPKKKLNDICLVPCAKPTNVIANDQLISFLKKIHKFKYLGIKFIFTGDLPEYLKKNIFLFAKKENLDAGKFYFLENKKNINIKNFFLQKINPSKLGFEKKLSFEYICSCTNKSLILSFLGYGVKTKILELIAHGHNVFLNDKIFNLQDNIVKRNTEKFNSINELKKKIRKKFKINKNINILLKKNYYVVLDKIFKVHDGN